MSYVNQNSLRTEFDNIKAEFTELTESNKISQESKVLFKSMFALFEIMLAIFLERTTKKDSKNSSKPSSQTEKDESSKSETGSKGKGKKETDQQFVNSQSKETITVSSVEFCNNCGEDLSNRKVQKHERRTKIDIIFTKVVEHVDAEVKTCPICERTNKGKFPKDFLGVLQYGLGIKAYVLDLLIAQMISLNRIQKSIKTLIGKVISESTILKYVKQLYESLEQWEQASIEQILKMAAINADETSLRVNKKNYWVHVYSSGDITLKFLHTKRGKEAIEDIDIIPKYGGVVIHDCWASYLSYNHCRHGLCGSHLLRELTFIFDSNRYRWALNMKKLLQETCKKVSKSKEKKLNDQDYSNLQKRYRNILTRGQKELPEIVKKQTGKRGKVAKSDAHNLWERLKNHEQAVLMFAKEPEVSFTNNRAERDLRMGKVKQKVSGCFRSEFFAHCYCRISSYLQTMANKGYNPLVAIELALTGQLQLQTCE